MKKLKSIVAGTLVVAIATLFTPSLNAVEGGNSCANTKELEIAGNKVTCTLSNDKTPTIVMRHGNPGENFVEMLSAENHCETGKVA